MPAEPTKRPGVSRPRATPDVHRPVARCASTRHATAASIAPTRSGRRSRTKGAMQARLPRSPWHRLSLPPRPRSRTCSVAASTWAPPAERPSRMAMAWRAAISPGAPWHQALVACGCSGPLRRSGQLHRSASHAASPWASASRARSVAPIVAGERRVATQRERDARGAVPEPEQWHRRVRVRPGRAVGTADRVGAQPLGDATDDGGDVGIGGAEGEQDEQRAGAATDHVERGVGLDARRQQTRGRGDVGAQRGVVQRRGDVVDREQQAGDRGEGTEGRPAAGELLGAAAHGPASEVGEVAAAGLAGQVGEEDGDAGGAVVDVRAGQPEVVVVAGGQHPGPRDVIATAQRQGGEAVADGHGLVEQPAGRARRREGRSSRFGPGVGPGGGPAASRTSMLSRAQ